MRATHSAVHVDQSGMGIFSWLPLVRAEFFQIHPSVITWMGQERRDGRIDDS